MTLKLAARSEKPGANGSAGPPIMKDRLYNVSPQKFIENNNSQYTMINETRLS